MNDTPWKCIERMQNETVGWDREEWLNSARKLVHWASQTPFDSRLMLLIRHSHRETVGDHSVQLSTELTQLGCDMSAEMGRRLPYDRRTLIFFSFVSRAYQTADEIRKGIVENGGIVEDFDALAVLTAPEVKNQEFWNSLHPDGKNITDFVNQWADGVFGDMVEEFDDYRFRLLNDTMKRVQGASKSSMHIHITHDLALMAAKRILLNRAVELQDREPFLGGIGILFDDDGLTLYSSGETISLDEF